MHPTVVAVFFALILATVPSLLAQGRPPLSLTPQALTDVPPEGLIGSADPAIESAPAPFTVALLTPAAAAIPIISTNATNAASIWPFSADDTGFVYTHLTLKQKYIYSIERTFAASRLLLFGVRAGFDQVRDSPTGWGSGEEGYAIRFASHVGRSLVAENIAFGVRAFDHEDPRYFRLARGSGWRRTRYAIVHAYVARSDRGGEMPAYSTFVAAFGMPAIARTWHPGPVTLGDDARSGAIALGLGSVVNIGQEFLPDLKALFHR
jgi:hypothetical protein